MRVLMGAAVAWLLATPELAHAQSRGGLNAQCEAASQCNERLRCVSNVCVDEIMRWALTYEASQPPDTHRSDAAHGYVGFALGASLPAFWSTWGESVQLSLHAGVLIGGFQFQIEVTPAMPLFGLNSSTMGLVDVTGTAGYLVPLSDMVSWIFRIGGGAGAVFGIPQNPGCGINVSSLLCNSAAGFAEFRLDVFGVAIRPSKHVLIELNVPSWRVMIMQAFVPYPNGNVMMQWLTNAAFSYVF